MDVVRMYGEREKREDGLACGVPRAGPLVLVGGAAALGPQIIGAPSHICMQYTIYEGPNPDMC